MGNLKIALQHVINNSEVIKHGEPKNSSPACNKQYNSYCFDICTHNDDLITSLLYNFVGKFIINNYFRH